MRQIKGLTVQAGLPMPTELINTQQDLDALVARIYESGSFAFDTEFIPEDTYEPELCLIQVATPKELAVVDPRVIPRLAVFWNAVLDESLDVVVHAGSEDLRICYLQTGQLPQRVFDIQIAAGLVTAAYPSSLTSLVQRYIGKTVNSSETRTDWRKRPLTPGQIQYALDDVRHLLPIAEILRQKLHDNGRLEWNEEESRVLLAEIVKRDHPDRWMRISGVHTLNRRSQEIARRLFGWRLDIAIRTNRPVRQSMRDDLLVSIAKRQPKSRADLENLRDFNKSSHLKAAPEILNIVQQAMKVPDNELPRLPRRVDDLAGGSMLVGIMTAAMAYACVQAQVAQGLVGSISDIKDLVRWSLEGKPADDLPQLLQAWRADVCGNLMLDVLEGRKALRVIDPAADVPVSIE
jgi:ribonuclease D